MDVKDSRLCLVTGAADAGKTSFCRLAAGLARAADWKVAGLLSPAKLEQGHKVGILAEDLLTGEVCHLASNAPGNGFDLPVGRWHFSPACLEWGSQVLRSCLPCDLLIVDELGPLELKHGRGWAAALVTLKQSGFRQALAVVRPKLLELAVHQLPGANVISLQHGQALETGVQLWWDKLSHRAA